MVDVYDDVSFHPAKTINRAEFLKIVIGGRYSEELQRKNFNEKCFDDIYNSTHWYVPYACFAKEWGIISGYDGKYLKPENNINLVEAAKIIANVYGGNALKLTEDSVWYEPFMKYLLENRMVPPSLTKFDQILTRGEMAEMISRAIRLRNGQLNSYLEFRQNQYNENIYPAWDTFDTNDQAGAPVYEEETPSNTAQEWYKAYAKVMLGEHPGTYVSGGYLSSYDQWTDASYSAKEANHTLSASEIDALQQELLSAINVERQKTTHALTRDANLELAAQAFAVHLVMNAFYGHTDKFGRQPVERAALFGVEGWVSESLVWRKSGVAEAINWWKNSDLHWNNMSNARYHTGGVGVAQEPGGGYIFVFMTGE